MFYCTDIVLAILPMCIWCDFART